MFTGSTEEMFGDKEFGRRIGPGRRPALIVVDLQVGLTEPGWPLYGSHDDVVAASGQLVDAARQAGVPVVFTRVAYDPAEVETCCYAILHKAPLMRTLTTDSRSVDIDPRLSCGPADFLLTKKGQSAFLGTPLSAILTGLGVDTVIVTGANTSGCVRVTVTDACGLGYHVLLAQDCLGDLTREVHDASLADMDAKNGDLWAQDDLLGYLDAVGRADSAVEEAAAR